MVATAVTRTLSPWRSKLALAGQCIRGLLIKSFRRRSRARSHKSILAAIEVAGLSCGSMKSHPRFVSLLRGYSKRLHFTFEGLGRWKQFAKILFVDLTIERHLQERRRSRGCLAVRRNQTAPQLCEFQSALSVLLDKSENSRVIVGTPKKAHISTSMVERQNLTMRMSMRRFTRLTNAFSKKLENLQAAVALHFAHYKLVRLHKTLRVTPAMAANVTDRVWSLEELVEGTSKRDGKA